MIDSLVARLCPSIQQHTDLGIQLLANGIEEPTMRVDLFRVFLLETKDDLDGYLA